MEAPPFRVLEYDARQRHGQIWIKHRIHRTLEALPAEERPRQRFVVWLPLAEDRLERRGPDGEPALELLAEYRIAGVTWRVDGRRPTLFRFLKQAGVTLPAAPGDQRRLWEGGRDSLLAKYAARFADRPAAFWRNLLSPELARSGLIGDVDRTILDLAVSPETTWQDLDEKGLVAEFVALVRERYGFEGPRDRPADWVAALVAALGADRDLSRVRRARRFSAGRSPAAGGPASPPPGAAATLVARQREPGRLGPLDSGCRSYDRPRGLGAGQGGVLLRFPPPRAHALAAGRGGVRRRRTEVVDHRRLLRRARRADRPRGGVQQGEPQPPPAPGCCCIGSRSS